MSSFIDATPKLILRLTILLVLSLLTFSNSALAEVSDRMKELRKIPGKLSPKDTNINGLLE
jgi:hypothetical protein